MSIRIPGPTGDPLDYILDPFAGDDPAEAAAAATPVPAPPPAPPAATGAWQAFDAFLDTLPGTPRAVDGNRVSLEVDGPSAFPAMFAAIEGARSSIDYETYQLWGNAGRDLAAALVRKAQSGVEVRAIIDEGSLKYGADAIAILTEAAKTCPALNVAIAPEHIVAGAVGTVGGGRGTLPMVDHRKGLIVDGATAFMGGMNTTDEERTGVIHDMNARLDGPAAAQLRSVFQDHWHDLRPADPVPPIVAPPAATPPSDPGQNVRIVAHAPGKDENIRDLYLKAIGSAGRSIRIEDPYFTDPPIMNALIAAAKRGVAIQLVWPAHNNEDVAQQAARSWYPALLAAGIGVYEYRDRMAHEKVAVFDGKVATIGSSNLDPVSLTGDLEHNMVAIDRDGRQGFAHSLEAQILLDINRDSDRVSGVMWDDTWNALSGEEQASWTGSRGRIVALGDGGQVLSDPYMAAHGPPLKLAPYTGTDVGLENLIEPHGPLIDG